MDTVSILHPCVLDCRWKQKGSLKKKKKSIGDFFKSQMQLNFKHLKNMEKHKAKFSNSMQLWTENFSDSLIAAVEHVSDDGWHVSEVSPACKPRFPCELSVNLIFKDWVAFDLLGPHSCLVVPHVTGTAV